MMLWAAALLCFFGFMRSGELTIPSDSSYDESAHLSFKYVSVDSFRNPQVLRVRIKASKTDLFRLGVDYLWGRQAMSCVLSQLLSYMVRRGPNPVLFLNLQVEFPLPDLGLLQKLRRVLLKQAWMLADT